MSKTEGFVILDAENAATIGDAAKKAAGPRPQNVVRRKLADISNLPQNQRLLIQEEKSQSIEMTAKEYIEQLQKENMVLVKMLAQRNKIIEQSGIELDRLRVNLLKMQEQNQQLALSNTQMLVELNSGRDRLKLLQHELGCKSGLFKARKLELEGRAKIKLCKNADAELIKSQEEGESLKEGITDEKPHKTKRSFQSNGLGSSEQVQSEDKIENKRPLVRRQSARFKAAEVKPAEDSFETNSSYSTKVSASQLPDDKDQTENKRPFVRRQSARFKAAEVKPAGDLFETDGTKVSESQLPDDKDNTENKRHFVRRQSARFKPVDVKPAKDLVETDGAKVSESQLPDDTAQDQGPASETALVKNESNIVSSGLRHESQEFGRSSLCRPSRVAAKKVQSYKEIPINIKMRRSE